MSRIVAVSNRVMLPRRGNAPGGLVVGVLAAMKSRGGLWFGWNGEVEDPCTPEPTVHRRDNVTYATLSLSSEESRDYYQGFCNSTLWPLFHYFLDGFRFHDAQYESYLAVNRRFAQHLLPLLRADDVIWVHDYHFLPLARQLRQSGVQLPIGMFLHIPFPHIDSLRVLPVHAELIDSMLDFDLVGFQTRSDLDAFLTAVRVVRGPGSVAGDDGVLVNGRCVRVGVFPIGVDVDLVQQEALLAQRGEPCQRMIRGLIGKRLMIGVDRLDYSKGLVQRFKAYEQFLESHPQARNRVTYIQIAPLSRSDVHAYAAIRSELEQTAGRVNGRLAETDWTPIRYLNRNFPHGTLMGFMRNAPVGLVTPLRDGMNLVAKEFIAAQDPSDPGVLILSTLAGAARELTEALQVNPYDIRGMADAMERAFNMPREERIQRHESMLRALRSNDIAAWHSRFLELLCQPAAATGGCSFDAEASRRASRARRWS
ncbi:MAG: trehalose-6-phosphate synthase [Proteobacteria bacterium]|nr:trehalose-6-phosphate synthase [Pseudomonadota bacterium]